MPGLLSDVKSAARDIRDTLAIDPLRVGVGYDYAQAAYRSAAPQLAAAGDGYAAPQVEKVSVEQPIQIILNSRMVGEASYQYVKTQLRARG